MGYVEIDKYARQSYQAIHDTKGEWTSNDITQITDDEFKQFTGSIDVICGGFPCQAFSIAGKRGGFSDTRGTLFFHIARAVEQIKPRFLLLENVKGLLSHDKGKTFATILTTLDELGYDAEWQVCNSKNFGIPQNRERVFIVGHFRGESGREVFPITTNNGQVDELQGQPLCTNIITARYEGAQATGSYIVESEQYAQEIKVIGRLGIKGNDQINRIYSVDGISPTITTMGGGNTEPKILYNHRIRKLTPLECWRLQGFPDEAFYKAKETGVSDTQLYKQAGNSVTVDVVYEVAGRLNIG